MSLMTARLLDTDDWSKRYRDASVNLRTRQLLITNFVSSQQEDDLSEPANCRGFGRVRHFHRQVPGWVSNPLPIDPAVAKLGLPPTDALEAQVFQNAACNWRCWYCYVPFSMLSANPRRSSWLSATVLVDLYLAEVEPRRVIDLSGGQPDLVPEWVPWMMDELTRRKLDSSVYLWSDDNLSVDYFWRFLSEDEISRVATYSNYGRVGCLKGFNESSFSFNTRAAPELFQRQFELMRRFLESGIDMYGYVTLTTPTETGIADDMARFCDRLQRLDYYFPLRTVPLDIQVYGPVRQRLDPVKRLALAHQRRALDRWLAELDQRFTSEERQWPIHKVPLARRPRVDIDAVH